MNKYALTEEQLMIQEMAKKFADQVVAETVTDLDRRHAFPVEEVKQCAEMGFLGICVPEEYGGAGMDYETTAMIFEEIAKVDAGYADTLVTTFVALRNVILAGTPEQARYFADTINQGKFACFAITEPGAGSDAGALRATAVADGDDYILNGVKVFATNGACA